MARLDGKVAVVTGAARGIGEAVARALAREGATAVLADRDGTGVAEAAARLVRSGARASAFPLDVGDAGSVAAVFQQIHDVHGRLDILVNNAGVARIESFLDHSLEAWDLTLRVNLTGTFLCGQAAARLMARGAGGAIVNIASISGQRGGNGRAAYGASKAGVIGLTKVMAVDLAPHGIRVNAIAPGPIETEMTRTGHTAESRAAYHRLVPQGRYGSTDDIAAAVVFLVSSESGYITGHVLNVDGGFGAAGLMFSDLPGSS